MGDPKFKNDNEKKAYLSVLENVINAIHSYEFNGQIFEVDESNYASVEEDLQEDIKFGSLLKANGYPIKEDTTPYDLFFPLIVGKEGKEYASGKNSFLFCVRDDPDKDGLFYSMTVDNKGAKAGKEGKSLKDIKKNSKPDIEDLPPDDPIRRDKELTEQVHKENAQDRAKFGEFAKNLREAAKSTSRDSGEYKDIIKLLDAFENKVDFSKSKEPARSDWQKLDKEQRLALPMVLLKEKIDKYLEHKAKDGIKLNTFYKLAAVEKLNQYIGKRVEEIKPRDFSFLGKPYQPGLIKMAPKDEYEAVKEGWEREHRQDLPFYGTEELDFQQLIQPMEKRWRNEGKNIDLLDINEIANANRCIDRIKLKVQTKYEGDKKDELITRLISESNAFLDNPQPSKQKLAEAAKKAKGNAPTV